MAVEVSWFTVVVDCMAEHRADGASFDRAWMLATRLWPPGAKLSGGYGQQRLAINGDETVVGFFRRVCEDAWMDVRGPAGSGNGPGLRHFRVEMLADDPAELPLRRAA